MDTVLIDKNRYLVNLMLKRAKRFHASVSGCREIDCHETLRYLREMRKRGEPASMTAYLVKASAAVVQKYPRLNRHVFTSLTGRQRIVQFDDIACTLVVRREVDSSAVILPANIENPEQKSIAEIGAEIRFYSEAPLEQLPQYRALQTATKLPDLLLDYISYKTRSSPAFYRKHYGTYGLSAMYSFPYGYQSLHVMANTAMALIPHGLVTKTDASGARRKHLRIAMVFDHFVIDGDLIAAAARAMAQFIENPNSLA